MDNTSGYVFYIITPVIYWLLKKEDRLITIGSYLIFKDVDMLAFFLRLPDAGAFQEGVVLTIIITIILFVIHIKIEIPTVT